MAILKPSVKPSGSDPVSRLQDALSVHFPSWLVYSLGVLVAIAALMAAVKPFVSLPRWLGQRLARLALRVRGEQDSERAQRRAMFADHIESQIRILGDKEDWKDSRFTELEAEVELEGEQGRRFRWLPRLTNFNGVRREPSLSKALKRSEERLVLLIGDPGAGKSVALRHLAQSMAKKAMTPSNKSVIPIYVNLKEFRPASGPDAETVKTFILESVNRARSRDITRFLEAEFDRGIAAGTWLFLLDSFDEIPEVLASTEVDDTVTRYAEAIYSFLHGMSKCRGIVASRDFRGPKGLGWPRFKVMALSPAKKEQLVRRARLSQHVTDELLTGLMTASPDIRQLSDNPLFLGLLCEYVANGRGFPVNAHEPLESYVDHRLHRDADLLLSKFSVSPERLRRFAEATAMAMASGGIGLSPSRAALLRELSSEGFVSTADANALMNALEYIRLAKSVNELGTDAGMTFSHRRFQEYFATSVVLRSPNEVPMRELLTDMRWRETAVTVLQTQSRDRVAPVLAQAEALLEEINQDSTAQQAPAQGAGTDVFTGYPWPPGSLHLLGILNAGIRTDLTADAGAVRQKADVILGAAWSSGLRYDQRWVLDVLGAATTATQQQLLREAFASSSEWLRDGAYTQLPRLDHAFADDLGSHVREALFAQYVRGPSRQRRATMMAELRRLRDPKPHIAALRLLTALPYIDLGFLALVGLMAYGLPVEIKGQPIANLLVMGFILYPTLVLMRNGLSILRGRAPSNGLVAFASYFGLPLENGLGLIAAALYLRLIIPMITMPMIPAASEFVGYQADTSSPEFHPGQWSLPVTAAVIVAFYQAVWIPSAMFVVLSRRSDRLQASLAVAPVQVTLHLLRGLNWARATRLLLSLLAVLVGCATGAVLLYRALPGTALAIVFLCLFALFCLLVPVRVIQAVVRSHGDRMNADLAAARMEEGRISEPELLVHIMDARTASGLSLLFRTMRRCQERTPQEAVACVAREFAMTVELNQKAAMKGGVVDATHAVHVVGASIAVDRPWLESYVRTDARRLLKVPAEAVDEAWIAASLPASHPQVDAATTARPDRKGE
jgi:hypothetical protein